MLIKEKIGNIKNIEAGARSIDYVCVEWYETSKRILHKKTVGGNEVSFKFLNGAQYLTEGDIVYSDHELLIVVQINACDAIVIKPLTMYQMAWACYEIGNKHLPLFYEEDELLIPYEAPLLKLLQASGFEVHVEKRKLLNALKTTVAPHAHTSESKSLFSRILQLTSPNE